MAKSPTSTRRSSRRTSIKRRSFSINSSYFNNFNNLNNKRSKGVSGVGYIFGRSDHNGGYTVTKLSSRFLSADDCINPTRLIRGIHHDNCKNNDGSYNVLIDNTNLNCYKTNNIDILIKNRNKKDPMCVLSKDNGTTWQLIKLFYIHPECVSYRHAYFDTDNRLIICDDVYTENVMQLAKTSPYKKNAFLVRYVNQITASSNANDGFIQCDKGGPLMNCDVNQPQIDTIVENSKRFLPIVEGMSKKSGIRCTNTLKRLDGSGSVTRGYKKDDTLAAQQRRTVFCRPVDTSNQEGVALPLIPEGGITNETTHIDIAHLSPAKFNTLLHSHVDVSNQGRITHNALRDYVRVNASYITKNVPIDSVHEKGGLVYEITDDNEKVGKADTEHYCTMEPYDRPGKIVASWISINNNDAIDIETQRLAYMLEFTFGSKVSDLRGVCESWGVNKYFGTNRSSRPLASPRKGRENVTNSDRWCEIPNPLFLPCIIEAVNKLTIESNRFGAAADPLMCQFQQVVFAKCVNGESISCNTTQEDRFNGLKLVTSGWKGFRGFFNTKHCDRNDAFQNQFNQVGNNILRKSLHKCTTSTSPAESSSPSQSPVTSSPTTSDPKVSPSSGPESSSPISGHLIKAIVHIYRSAYQFKNDKPEWRLQPTCGHQVRYDNDRRNICALFYYNALNHVVQIPKNCVSYQTWDSSLHHQTTVPFTYGK